MYANILLKSFAMPSKLEEQLLIVAVGYLAFNPSPFLYFNTFVTLIIVQCEALVKERGLFSENLS